MDQNDNFFFLLILRRSRPVFAFKEAILKFFDFRIFFAIFLEFPTPDWVGTDRNDFFFLSFSACPMFFNFLNFFAIFLEFRISVRVRMDQNENFFFFTFSASPIPFFLEKKPY